MRQGKVYYNNDLAGIITETDDGEYLFSYPEDTEEMALTINGRKRRQIYPGSSELHRTNCNKKLEIRLTS
ncbi:MAG: hypothetical protein PHV53_04400 [Fermentimonas sp.]|nr:hypothetical protein [Fermentimonas sp.]